jgi:hypothetical protein
MDPDFLLRLVALASFMLLSATKAAHAAVSGDAWQEIRAKVTVYARNVRRAALDLTPGEGLREDGR